MGDRDDNVSWIRRPGVLCAGPVSLLLLAGFAGPLVILLGYSFMPPRTFSLLQAPTLANFVSVVTDSYYVSFSWSLILATTTVVLLFLVCYPIAYGMAKLFGWWANLVTALVALPLLISENIRLFGWVLILLKNGILDGTLQHVFGFSASGMLYTVPAIVLGMVYVYLPFMLFPLTIGISMVPDSLKEAAFDLGASRWQVFREVELPLSMPGIMIGGILTFVLTLGSLAESKILGGQAVVMIADDIESAFTFAQNWPKGSVLSVLLIGLSGLIVFMLLRRIDLDRIIGRR
ncbi:MAG: ABC transporter permease [Gammaproteobacteria bacterium]|nr:ABC transporter permease [Gammaproteobacteria bacterium]